MNSPRMIPPLHTLAAFEAAARLESFARAADELCVTHSAVSHRIRLLEEHLGTRLFLRVAKRVVLTAQGEELLGCVREALETLRAGAARAARGPARRLKVTTPASFAHSWLVPRVHGFLQQFLDIDLDVDTTPSLVNLKSGEADLAIRYGAGRWEGLESRPLLPDELQPVCSPALAERLGGLAAPADLRRATLLRHTMQRWEPWFRKAGLDWEEPAQGPRFCDSVVILEAAAEGQGVALGKTLLARPYLQSSRLVAPFPITATTDLGFHLVCSRSAVRRAEVQRFMEWITAEASGASAGKPTAVAEPDSAGERPVPRAGVARGRGGTRRRAPDNA